MIRALRQAAPILIVYWLVLLAGLGCYTLLRGDDLAAIEPLWYGAVIGTVFGNAFALKSFRPWLLVVIVSFIICWALGFDGGTLIWMAFVPAVLCGYWALGDRTSLVAFWYPAMIWMLSILDQTSASGTLESAGVGLVVVLAVMFVVFLRARESRRVKLWRTVAFEKLATQTSLQVLKEPPARRFARATWIAAIGSLACGLTAWVAPSLWHAESYEHHERQATTAMHVGLACCPIVDDVSMRRVRVKEYMNLGRGRDEITAHRREACHVCGGSTIAGSADRYSLRFDASSYDYQGGGGGVGGGDFGEPVPTRPQLIMRDYVPPMIGGSEHPIASTVGEGGMQPTYAPPPATTAQPVAAPNTPPAVPHVEPQAPPAPPPVSEPAQQPQPSAAQPAPRPTQAAVSDGSLPAAAPASFDEHRSHPIAAKLLIVLAWLVGIALVAQLVLLALRPVRRAIALRHLRDPLWTETVDQRISNSWQLALVGLRDAGWRTTDEETPRELARRVGIDGVADCAAILERARHGIGIDAGDLDAMRTHANIAYRSARSRLGWFGKALAATRWPLA